MQPGAAGRARGLGVPALEMGCSIYTEVREGLLQGVGCGL